MLFLLTAVGHDSSSVLMNQKDSISSRNNCFIQIITGAVKRMCEKWERRACLSLHYLRTWKWARERPSWRNSFNLFIQYKRRYFFNKWFILSGCTSLFWVYWKLYGMFNFYTFQHFILSVALCVRETRAKPVCGSFKKLPCFLYFSRNHVSVFRSSSPHFHVLFFQVYIFTLLPYSQCLFS